MFQLPDMLLSICLQLCLRLLHFFRSFCTFPCIVAPPLFIDSSVAAVSTGEAKLWLQELGVYLTREEAAGGYNVVARLGSTIQVSFFQDT